MRAGLSSSFLTHVVVLIVAQFGLPGSCSQPEVVAQYVPVDLVSEQQLAALIEQPQPVDPPPEPEIVEAPPPPPPPPEPPPPETVEVQEPPPATVETPVPPPPEIVEAPPPPPEPPPEPPQDVVTLPPPPPQPTQQDEPLPDIRPERRPEPPPRPDDVEIAEETLPGVEEPPQDPDIHDVIKDLAGADEDAVNSPEPPQVEQSDLLASAPPDQATRSEIDALKRMIVDQISKCWAPPMGAPNAEDLSVQIRVHLNAAGGVEAVSVVDRGRMDTDRYFRAAAEAATRAILNDRCNPLTLPPDKYDLWKDIRFTFNPAEMFG